MTEAARPVTYEEFGRLFVMQAVTPARVADAIHAMAGDRIELDGVRAGPGNLASVSAFASIAKPGVTTTGTDPVAFVATLPVALELTVKVAGTRHELAADVEVPLQLEVQTHSPLTIVVEVEPPDPRAVAVTMHTAGLRQRVLQLVGDVETEVRRHVVRTVRTRLDSPDAYAARVIDVLPLIDRAWQPG